MTFDPAGAAPRPARAPKGGWGGGLIKGLATTLSVMVRPAVTQQYPEVQPALPPRSRGVIALVEENCTSCMLCARECPDWCIYIDSHKETAPAETPGGRDRTYNVLDRFAIDFSLCMYCGICIEVCPFDALFWSPEFEYSEFDIRELVHEKDRLGEWVATVPPPPALDARSAVPKELENAAKAVSKPAPAATTPAVEQVAARPQGTAQKPLADSAQQTHTSAAEKAEQAGEGEGASGGTTREGGAAP